MNGFANFYLCRTVPCPRPAEFAKIPEFRNNGGSIECTKKEKVMEKREASVKCDICLGMFAPEAGYKPCANCGRNFCPAHQEKELVNELIREELRWCKKCGNAYRAGGLEGVERERKVPFFTHGS